LSHTALNWAFDAEMDDATAKSVLVALANDARKDSWQAYPSVERLTRHTALGDRAIQGALKRLIGWGAVFPEYRRGQVTIYTLNKDWKGAVPRSSTPAPKTGVKRAPTPAADAPPQQMHPRISQQKPPHLTTNTPAADAGDPLREPILTKAAATARAIGAIETIFPDLKTNMAFASLTGSLGMLTGWLGDGADLERDVLPAITAVCMRERAKGHGPPRTMGYFAGAVADTKAANEQGLPNASAPRPNRQQPQHRDGWSELASAEFREAG
jgi:hypothetical protein